MTSRLNALTQRDSPAIPDSSLVEEATVTTTPTALTDDLYVVLDDFDDHRQIGPVQGWQTMGTWPVRGDRALVVQAIQGDYWLINTTPTTGRPVWEPITSLLHPDWTVVRTPQVARNNGMVHLRGVIQLAGSSTTGSIIVPHLAAAYRPLADRYCAFQIDTNTPSVTLSGWTGQLNLYTDGELALNAGRLVRGDMLGSTLIFGFLAGQTLVLDGLHFSI